MIQDTRMAVPPTNGVQLNVALILAPGVIAESRGDIDRCSMMIFGKLRPRSGPGHDDGNQYRDWQPGHADIAGQTSP